MSSKNKNNGARRSKARSKESAKPTLAARAVEERIASDAGGNSGRKERRRQSRDAPRSPRTASGKGSDPQLMAEAALEAQDYLRERTEAGHRAAGRTPPSERTATRGAGALRIIEDSLRRAVRAGPGVVEVV